MTPKQVLGMWIVFLGNAALALSPITNCRTLGVCYTVFTWLVLWLGFNSPNDGNQSSHR